MTKPAINVTPLIDVLLVLLIIFMVVSPMKPSRFEARIPAEPSDDINIGNHPLTLVVSIDQNRSIDLNKDRDIASLDDPEPLSALLRQIFRLRKENEVFTNNGDLSGVGQVQRTVFIKGPRSVRYGDIAKLVDVVKTAGADPISLQIEGLTD